jgi:hypothetical protein
LDNLNCPEHIYAGDITRWRGSSSSSGGGGGSSSSSSSPATTDTKRELLRRWRRDGPIRRGRRKVQNPVVHRCKAPRRVTRGILQLIQLPPPETFCKGFGVCVERSARGPVRDAVQRQLRKNIANATAFSIGSSRLLQHAAAFLLYGRHGCKALREVPAVDLRGGKLHDVAGALRGRSKREAVGAALCLTLGARCPRSLGDVAAGGRRVDG